MEEAVMRRFAVALPLLCLTLAAAPPTPAPTPSPTPAPANTELVEQVRRAETAFAKTMADRDHAAFVSFLAEEAIFGAGARELRGKEAVAAGWKRYYEGAQAPFAWAPENVAVLDSGSLAFSSGPVTDPTGKRVGTFNSVWRREAGGPWKIVLDRGCPPCDCPAAPAGE
jgi:ketosteroid isomerase-like protein